MLLMTNAKVEVEPVESVVSVEPVGLDISRKQTHRKNIGVRSQLNMLRPDEIGSAFHWAGIPPLLNTLRSFLRNSGEMSFALSLHEFHWARI